MTRDELDALKRELVIEQIKFYRAANEERECEEREREFELFLARRFGYPPPRRGRR
jgi:hypothetical protein